MAKHYLVKKDSKWSVIDGDAETIAIKGAIWWVTDGKLIKVMCKNRKCFKYKKLRDLSTWNVFHNHTVKHKDGRQVTYDKLINCTYCSCGKFLSVVEDLDPDS